MLALLASVGASAATKTTAPGKTILVYFIFTDKKLLLGVYREGPDGANDLYLGTPPTRRGLRDLLRPESWTQDALVDVHEEDVHGQAGEKGPLQPAAARSRRVSLLSPSNPGKAFRGALNVT